MSRNNIVVVSILLLIFAFAICALIYPLLGREGMQLGLDLVGGVHLVYQAQFPEGATAEEKARDMQRAVQTIQNRIDKYGVTEPIIQQQEGERILVQLPGFTDIDEAKRLVGQTGFLEFREVELKGDSSLVYLKDYLAEDVSDFFDNDEQGTRIFVDENNNAIALLIKDEEGNLSFTDEQGNPLDVEVLKQGETGVLSWIPARGDDGTPLTGDLLADAAPAIRQEGASTIPIVSIEWDEKGTDIFDQIALRLHNPNCDTVPYSPIYALGIFLDNTLISAPQICSPAFYGSGEISGNFTVDEASLLANLLVSGALPMPLEKEPLYEEQVSETLGSSFIELSIMAGVIGLILVMIFMIAYYRLPGAMACIALAFYGAVVLAIFKLIPVTLTLAGIGGFVLSIGMAVDANVLIFERMKEEFKTGRTLGAAIGVGFSRAWPAIRDSNITTIIVCIILYWLGSSIVQSAPVMGFALTLLIGVIVSMFTAIVVTRTLLRLFIGTGLARRTSLFTMYAKERG
jgi:protein-export membrane protein SecD